MKWKIRRSPFFGQRQLAALPTDADDAYKKKHPGSTSSQRQQWHKEDVAYGEFAADVLAAAAEGVDTSFLRDCPDLTALAMYRKYGPDV